MRRSLLRDVTADIKRRYAGAEACTLVAADDDGTILGTASVAAVPWVRGRPLQRQEDMDNPPEGATLRPVVANVVVAAAARRRGVARVLMRACEEQAREWGYDELTLLVNPGNRRARALYSKLGFQVPDVPRQSLGRAHSQRSRRYPLGRPSRACSRSDRRAREHVTWLLVTRVPD